MRPLGTSDPVAVGPYRSIAVLGRGRTGRVLLGVAPDGRLVALRLLHPYLMRDEGFRREVITSRDVVGPSTAPLLDGDLDAPVPWLATAYVPGPSLRQAGRLPADSVVVLAAGMAAALAEIHAVGLLHRNLNPANVLLADDGPKVIDFGISHAAGLAGTPGFVSPEQAAGQPASWASDVFAFGTVLYTAATGRNPFAAPSPQQTLANVVHVVPDLASVPDTVRWIVGPCLAKDPAGRPTPQQIMDAIGRPAPFPNPWPPAVQEMINRRRAEAARTVEAPPEPGTPPLVVETPEKRRKTAAIVGAGVVAMVFFTALAGVLLTYGGGPHTDAATAGQQPTTTTAPPPTTIATTTVTTTTTTTTTTSTANAVTIEAGTWYAIANAGTGKCLDASNNGSQDGTPVIEFDCGAGKANQAWQFIPSGNGFFRVLNRNAPKLALDVTGGSGATAPGTPVQLWTFGGGANQLWKAVEQGNGTFELIAQHSNACLDVPNTAGDGTQLDQQQCTGGPSQLFTLTEAH